MVKPGTNQVLRMPMACRKLRIRRDASSPNSPRDSGVGVVMPRAMKPDCVSKSKVRQTMWRGILRHGSVCWVEYKIAHGKEKHRDHFQTRHPAHKHPAAIAEHARSPP